MKLRKPYLFVSLVGFCLLAFTMFVAVQQRVVGAACSHHIVVNDHCLAESQWVNCAGGNASNCGGKKGKQSGSFQPLGTKYQSGSNTDTKSETENRYCYTAYECVWIQDDLQDPDGCYQKKNTVHDVPEDMSIYTPKICAE